MSGAVRRAAPGEAAPDLSVVVNTFDYARFLPEAIESALGQRGAAVEVVVVDDGSTDDTPAVLARYAGRIVAIRKANGGMGSAVNAGVAASRGSIVILLDADDALEPDAAARVIAAFRPGVAKVQWRLRVMDAAGRPTGGLAPAADVPLPSGDLRRRIATRFGYGCPPTSGNAYARAVLDRLLPLDEPLWRLSADYVLNMLAPFLGDVVSIDDAPLGRYRVHGGNHWLGFKPSLETRLALDVAQTLAVETEVRGLAERAGLAAARDLSLADAYYALLRLALRTIDPARYPRPADTRIGLGVAGVRALWAPSEAGARGGALTRRLGLSALFALLALLPPPPARLLAARAVRRRRTAQYRPRRARAGA